VFKKMKKNILGADVPKGFVQIDPKICVLTEDEVIQAVYGNGRLEDPEALKKRCLLTVRNEDSMELNEKVCRSLKQDTNF